MMQSGRSNEGASRQPPIDVSRSNLKADAAVFVPRFAMQPQQPVAPPPRQYQMFNPSQGTPEDWLKHAAQMMADPSAFDRIMGPLTDCLNKCLEDAEGKPELIELHVHDIVEFIFQRSVEDAQFRYMGAKMCNHFVHHLVNKDFRSVLLKRCQQEHQKRQELLSNPQQLFGYTLFMGEIMTKVMQTDQRTPMKFLAKPILELLVMLLDNPKEPCIKCAFQLLKMTGALLSDKEKEDNNGKTENLDIIFDKINVLLSNKDLDRRQRNMLECVVQQRANDWYRKKEEKAETNGSTQPTYVADDGTVFFTNPPASVRNRGGFTPSSYAPPPPPPQEPFQSADALFAGGNMDPALFQQLGGMLPPGMMPPSFLEGQDMNALVAGMQNLSSDMMTYPDGESGYPAYAPDDEMDDEIAAAFETFLKDTHQN